MSKGFRYWFRCITVATLTALITFNPVWAGRGIRALFSKRAGACCETVSVSSLSCCPPAPVDCCVSTCDSVPPIAVQSDCCPSEMTPPIVEGVVECCGVAAAPAIQYAPAQMVPMDMGAPLISPAPTEMAVPKDMGTPMPVPKDSDHAESPTPEAPAAPSVLDNLEPSPSDTTEKTEAAPADATTADPFGSPEPSLATPSADSPFGNAAEPAPADPTPNESLFGEPEMKPADIAPATDDPFAAPVEPAAEAEVPAEPAPVAPTENLFDAAPTTPTENLFDAAPTTPTENLFDAAPTTPTDNLFDAAPTAPAQDLFDNAPAEAAPAGDDPFGAPALPSGDNLFDAPAADPAPAADDLFGEPEPAAPAPPTNVDDLFGTPSAANGSNDAENGLGTAASLEATEPVADIFGQPTSTEAVSNDLNDLFGIPTVTEEEQAPLVDEPAVSQPEAAPAKDIFKSTRTWHDNTGLFQIDAKLVVIFSDSVRLLKENGKFCTLPIRRLSDADKQFVDYVAQLVPGGDAKYVSSDN